MSGHTKGPWVRRGSKIFSLTASRDRKVADVPIADNEGQSNAALIAAAPDLLDALEGMIFGAGAVAVPHAGERQVLQMAVDHARAAIAKAKGESQ